MFLIFSLSLSLPLSISPSLCLHPELGRQSLIEVEKRAAGVGLGIKTMHPSGESYKDAVKRTMIERYRELHEKEMQSKMN